MNIITKKLMGGGGYFKLSPWGDSGFLQCADGARGGDRHTLESRKGWRG